MVTQSDNPLCRQNGSARSTEQSARFTPSDMRNDAWRASLHKGEKPASPSDKEMGQAG